MRETVSFVLLRVLIFPKINNNKGQYINYFVIYLDFPLKNHMAKKKNKHAVVFSVWATIAQLYPGWNTFEFDQKSTNHSAHFVE